MLDLPISEIWKIKGAYQQRLHRLGIDKVRDLFFHFPYRYFDYSKITSISELKYQKEFLRHSGGKNDDSIYLDYIFSF